MNVDIALQKGSGHWPFIFVENDRSLSNVLLEGHVRPKLRERGKKAFYLKLSSWDKINKIPFGTATQSLHIGSVFSTGQYPASSVVNNFNITPCLPQQHSRKPNIRSHWKWQMVTAANKGKLLGHLSTFNQLFSAQITLALFYK